MSYRIDLAVLSEQDPFCKFGLTLHNFSNQDLTDWKLQFIFDRYILPDSVTNGVCQQIGSLCTITPNSDKITANQYFYCEFSLQTAPLRFYTDGIKQAVIIDTYGQIKHAVEVTPIVLASPFEQQTSIPDVEESPISIIPKPNNMVLFEGEFHLTSASQINLQTSLAEKAAMWLRSELTALFGFSLASIGHSDLLFNRNSVLDEEEYQLKVEASGITIEASSASGFVRACATLLQLIKVTEGNQSLSVPLINISDSPRFQYRGMMLDCARHFHSIEQVKCIINHLAYYKFNTFHWHLTDDEGWRVEIKAYPELTRIGAFRGPNQILEPQFSHLDQNYGGFYSQDEIREVIAYAQDRGITIIPEIDIPGHCRAAIKSLPDLLIDSDDLSTYRSIQHYSDNVLSPALKGTYTFIDAVLSEISQLFPAKWVHIGADEVPNGVWQNSPKCQAMMLELGYQSSKELQGHLLRYAEKKLHSLGKRMVGWEEAQHGDKVSKETVIYSWLSEEAALACAKQGFDVVLQPAQSTYLDMAQDYSPLEPGMNWASVIPLEKAYHYEPLEMLSDTDPIRKRILGIQCALWCEIIPHQSRIDYMVFPRISALAEVCWTQKSHRHWEEYLSRLKGHLTLLDKRGINYRQPWQQ